MGRGLSDMSKDDSTRLFHWPKTTTAGQALRAPALPRVVGSRLRLLSYAVFAILLAIGALVAAATLPILFGYHTYVVDGGSMESGLKNGSVAVAKATSPSSLAVGDVIAQRESPEGPAVLHRIVRITDDDTGRLLYTLGDADPAADPEPVTLLGTGDKVIYSVPYAGYILNFGESTLGRVLLLGAPLVLLASITLYEKSPRRRRQQRPESRQFSGETPEASGDLTLVPPSPTFQPAAKPISVSLVDLPDFRGLMNAARTLSEFPAAKHASIISFKSGTAVLEITLRVPLLAAEIAEGLQAGTGYRFLIEEVQPQRLRLRFVDPARQRELSSAA